MLSFLSKHIFFPLWDFKDRSIMLETVRELKQTQWLSEGQLRKMQWRKISDIIHYAYSNCEYYRDVFDRNGIKPGQIREWGDIQKIPILRKKDIRDNGSRLLVRSISTKDLRKAKTGGSTGTSLIVYFDKQCQEMRNAAAIRSDGWASWDLGDKKAAVWGNPTEAKTFRQKIRRAAIDRTIYLDTMNINQESVDKFIAKYRKYKPKIIYGHAHSIFILANYIRSKNITGISPKGIISTSMMLMENERKVIEDTFQCKVTNRYGCEEVGLIACECEKHEGLHLNIDHLYVEIVKPNGELARRGEEGSIIVTDLINKGMPLIRYRLEDVGRLEKKMCSCGRGLPLMESISGRVADFLVREDGSAVAGVSLVERTLTAIDGIQQMQIVQKEINEICLNIVTDYGYTNNSQKMLVSEFGKVFGEKVILQINEVDKIPQEKSGKYRFSICKVKSEYMS